MSDKPHSLKPRTIAAQALGAIEPATRAVALPVHVSTTYIRDPDNQYRAGYIYGRPDNATVRQTEAVIAALEGAHEAMLFGSGMAAATGVVLALPPGAPRARTEGMYWGFRDWLAASRRRLFGYRVDLVDIADLGAVRAADDAATPSWSGSRRPAIRSGPSPTSRRSPKSRIAAGAVLARQFDRRDAGVHAAARARRRHRDAFGDEISQRPFRRDRGRARDRARRRGSGRASRQVRASTAQSSARSRPGCCCAGCARSTCACAQQAESAALLAQRFANHASVSAVLYPGPADASRPRRSRCGRCRRLRRHAVDPRQGRRARRDRCRRARRNLEARDLARRRRKPDRAPRLDRGRRARPARPTCCGCRSDWKTSTISTPISIEH